MNWILKILVTALAVVLGAYLLPGIHVEDSIISIIIVAIVIGLLNAVVKPILIFLTLPATIVTLGLFLLVINACVILIADRLLGSKLEVDGFWWALLLSFIISITHSLFSKKDKQKSHQG